MRSLFAAAAALAIAGCAQQAAVNEKPLARAEAQVHFYDNRVPADKSGEYTIRFNDGSGERIVRPSDFRLREWGFPTSERLPTRSSGTLDIRVSLWREGRQVSEGEISLPLKSDWIYGVSLMAHARNPTEGSMGVIGVRSFPIEGEPLEKLHIVWGGNSISAPLPS